MFLERKLGFSIVHVDLGKGLVGELDVKMEWRNELLDAL